MPKIALAPWQFVALTQPNVHFAMFCGVATGKTYTGAHYVIRKIISRPDQTGFIGANTYDQLSQATLRELYYWLDAYGFDYVQDCLPPKSWGQKKKLKSYRNVLSVRYGRHVITIFTRVLSHGNPLRGIQFSWYWLDETRDTPQETHDIILSRMRETAEPQGLVTTTPVGEDWSMQRFMRGNTGDGIYGSLHVPTIRAVEIGIITQQYYDIMRRSYSPMMAMQELDALHVNVKGGRAYYPFGPHNRLFKAPWGDQRPNPERPLIVGCDFNFSPAPHIWMVGQQGPPEYDGPNKEYGPDCIHWFGELCEVEASTEFMAGRLVNEYPDFFYRIYGDASGEKGTTSNAGEHDYNQIAKVLSDSGHEFTIDVDQSNPLVRNRVENMNRLGKNAMGQVRQTYNQYRCPNFDADIRVVGWKTQVMTGQGKLSNGGDVQRTHATDGAGYAVYKLLPPTRRAMIQPGIPSSVRAGVNDLFEGGPLG